MFKVKKAALLLTVIFIGFVAVVLFSQTKPPDIHSKSAVLMDASTGNILFRKDAETAYPIASLSKLMTAYILLDSIENGVIGWTDEVMISETANSLGDRAVAIPIESGDVLTVEDLFKAMMISSANNATIALTEYTSGTEEAFTNLMNKKAKELGLSNQTYFVNATGLPDSTENTMSAEDAARLTYHLLKSHPHALLNTTNLQYDYISSHEIELVNTNKMLNENNPTTFLKGMDGLKTGFTDAAGYNFIGTATQKNKRFISVILDAKDDEARFLETKKLLSHGFGGFTIPPLKGTLKSFLQKIKLLK